MKSLAERKAAYAELEAAIEKLIDSHESFDEGEIPVGYVVIVCGARSLNRELDEDEDNPWYEGDEELMVSRYASFHKRGQMPVISRGLAESYIDRLRG